MTRKIVIEIEGKKYMKIEVGDFEDNNTEKKERKYTKIKAGWLKKKTA